MIAFDVTCRATVEDPTTRDRSAPPRYPGWATPLIAVISLGFLIAALGGPEPVLTLNVSASVLTIALASAVAGVAAALVLERRSYSRRRKPANRQPKAGSRSSSGWIVGAALLTVVVLRMVVSTSPFAAALIWGLFAGAGLAASAGFQWENRHPPPR